MRFKSVLAVLCVCAPVWAQQSLGSITGKVSDPQGAVIPNATVKVVHQEANRVVSLSTNNTGYFEATLLNPGTYVV